MHSRQSTRRIRLLFLACITLMTIPDAPALAGEDCKLLAGQTVNWIVPSKPGGGYDAYSRLLQPFLEEHLKARIVIANHALVMTQTALASIHPDDPYALCARWLREAADRGAPEPHAMALATATPAGRPSVRIVYYKELDESGLVFVTNYESRKGEELSTNPHAAVAYIEYANGLLMIEGDRRHGEAVKLYKKASACKPADAMERLDVEQAKAELT